MPYLTTPEERAKMPVSLRDGRSLFMRMPRQSNSPLCPTGPHTTPFPQGECSAVSRWGFCFGGVMPVELICEKCGALFSVAPYYAKRGQRFCSMVCAGLLRDRQPTPTVSCDVCGKSFKKTRNILRRTAHNFCSWACYTSWRRTSGVCSGASSHMWRGGPDLERRRWNKTPEGRAWTQAVKEAADQKCEHCSATTDLHAHHVKSFRDFPELRVEVSNGLCLCRSCHTKEEMRLWSRTRIGSRVTRYAVIPREERP